MKKWLKAVIGLTVLACTAYAGLMVLRIIDIPMEFGGGLVHSIIARCGRSGLQSLLKESESANERQTEYIKSAISGIRDPSLIGDLYAICNNAKYPKYVRFSSLSAIVEMRSQSPQVEQLVIDVAMDDTSDLRSGATASLGYFNTDKARQTLRKLNDASKMLDEYTKKSLGIALLRCDTDNIINKYVHDILSPNTDKEKKIELCRSIGIVNNANLANHIEIIKPCLNVTDQEGRPINDARVCIWGAIYRSTGEKLKLELMYDNDEKFEHVAYFIIEPLAKSLDNLHKYPYNQCRAMAKDEAKQLITKWEKSKKDGT